MREATAGLAAKPRRARATAVDTADDRAVTLARSPFAVGGQSSAIGHAAATTLSPSAVVMRPIPRCPRRTGRGASAALPSGSRERWRVLVWLRGPRDRTRLARRLEVEAGIRGSTGGSPCVAAESADRNSSGIHTPWLWPLGPVNTNQRDRLTMSQIQWSRHNQVTLRGESRTASAQGGPLQCHCRQETGR